MVHSSPTRRTYCLAIALIHMWSQDSGCGRRRFTTSSLTCRHPLPVRRSSLSSLLATKTCLRHCLIYTSMLTSSNTWYSWLSCVASPRTLFRWALPRIATLSASILPGCMTLRLFMKRRESYKTCWKSMTIECTGVNFSTRVQRFSKLLVTTWRSSRIESITRATKSLTTAGLRESCLIKRHATSTQTTSALLTLWMKSSQRVKFSRMSYESRHTSQAVSGYFLNFLKTLF